MTPSAPHDRARPPTVAVLGGSFDPPHLGHTLLVSLLRAQGRVDRVVVAPVFDHPFGREKARTPFARRLLWTRAAMQLHGDFVEVTDLERRLSAEQPGRPSHSLRLLDAVEREHPDARIRLVVGSDIVADGQTARWHRWDEVERRFDPLVVARAGYADPDACALPEVSSRAVRAAVARSDWDAVRRCVPEAVVRLLRQPPRDPVWVIGRGHVASHAEWWLEARGHPVVRVCARGIVDGSVRGPEVPPGAVWVLAADSGIEPVAEALAQSGVLPAGVPVFHGAGARSGRALLGALRPRHPVGSLHPICALRRERTWPSPLGEATFGLEGDAEARTFLAELVAPQPWLDLQHLNAQQRLAYHAACALAANHLSVLEAQATAVLVGQGQPAGAVTGAMRALMRSALANLQALGIPDGVTGPVARGDRRAVAAHLEALDDATAALYRHLTEGLAALLGRDRDP